MPWRLGIGDGEVNSHLAIAKRIAREARPRASSVRPDLSDSIDEILAQGLAIDPAERYESVETFAKALRSAIVEAKHGLTGGPDVEATIED